MDEEVYTSRKEKINMGTFVGYDGTMEIPKEKREEFLFRVQKIADLGGLMKLKKVSVHEREVLLLRPLELSKNGVAAGTTTFNFSYFEDDAWETAKFSGKDLYLCSEKVGEREFYDAMIALYSLYAIYDENPGWVIDNGRKVPWEQSMGWINHLFGTRYCPKDVAPIEQKENAETEPFSELTTSEYFRQTGFTAFWHMPGEAITEPDYILTDNDRLYWWNGTDEVIISEEVTTLFEEYNRLFKSMLENELTFRRVSGDYFCKAEDFTQEFMEILSDIDKQYRRIFPFESMFYEFIENKDHVEYRAAAGLLYYLSKRYAKEGKIIEKCGSWDIASKNIICNKGRMRIKQYLAVMANKKLREKFFGF